MAVEFGTVSAAGRIFEFNDFALVKALRIGYIHRYADGFAYRQSHGTFFLVAE